MTDFEKEMIEVQYELLKVQKQRNEILKSSFVVYDNYPAALEKIAMILEKIETSIDLLDK
jgi:hypothetical protein